MILPLPLDDELLRLEVEEGKVLVEDEGELLAGFDVELLVADVTALLATKLLELIDEARELGVSELLVLEDETAPEDDTELLDEAMLVAMVDGVLLDEEADTLLLDVEAA